MLDLKALKFNLLLFIFEYSHWSVEIITQNSSRLTIWLCKNQPNTFEPARNNILTQQQNIQRITCCRCTFTYILRPLRTQQKCLCVCLRLL